MTNKMETLHEMLASTDGRFTDLQAELATALFDKLGDESAFRGEDFLCSGLCRHCSGNETFEFLRGFDREFFFELGDLRDRLKAQAEASANAASNATTARRALNNLAGFKLFNE